MSLVDAFEITESLSLKERYQKVVEHVRDEYLKPPVQENPHKKRRNNIEERLRLLRDEYEGDVNSLIDLVFEHKQVKDQRKRIAQMAMSMNVTKSIIDSLSTLYDKPAQRRIDKSEERTRILKQIEEREEMDEFLPELQRLVNACNEVLLWKGEGERPRVITPDAFDLIPNPMNHLREAGFLLDWAPTTHLKGVEKVKLPHWQLWDDEFVVELNGLGRMIGEPQPHDLGEIPGLLIHRKKPTQKLLDADAGRDIVAAHKAVILLNLFIVRLSKSQGENQPVLQGDLARVASNQPMDGETPLGLPPGVDADVLKTKTDPEHLLKVIRHIVGSVASTYGLSYEQVVLKTDEETGRQRLIELRRQQGKTWRRIERKVFSFLGVDTDGLITDFAELALKNDARDEFDLFIEKMPKGLDNPVDFIRRQNPELSKKAAWAEFLRNIEINTEAFKKMRALNLPQDGDAQNLGNTPEENGRMGGRPQESTRTVARQAALEVVPARESEG